MKYEATTSTDFPDPKQERMVPNSKALESVSINKCSFEDGKVFYD